MNRFWSSLKGHSMSPSLLDQDEVLIEEVSYANLQLGDVVLFLDQESREVTLHRLIEFPFTTKGDLSLLSEKNPKEALIGKCLGFFRKGFYQKLPASDSLTGWLLITLSRSRLRGALTRKLAMVGLIVLSKVREVCSDKTRLDHKEELNLSDL